MRRIWRCKASFVGGRQSRFFFTLWRNAAALSALISFPSVPWLYSWQTNVSALAKTLASGGECSAKSLMSLDELSKIIKANCLPIPANWLVVSQPVIVWQASSDFFFSLGIEILWTGMYLFVLDVLQWQRSRLCARGRTRTSVSRHNTLERFSMTFTADGKRQRLPLIFYSLLVTLK